MPLDSGSQDAAYAIYSLKYFPQLDGVMKETARILKSKGKLVVYDLIKTDSYDQGKQEHREVRKLEHSLLFPIYTIKSQSFKKSHH